MRTSYSLSRRLIGWISLPILAASALVILLASVFTWHEIEEVYDAQLVHSAKVLLQFTKHDINQNNVAPLGTESADLSHKYERKTGFRVWVNDALITQSSSMQDFASFEAPPGFSDQVINNDKWRFFVFVDPIDKIRIEISERYEVRYELITQLISTLIIPSSLLIPVIVFLVWAGVRKSLNPVIKISADVDQRNSDDLSAIETGQSPTEILPLISALNRLFLRIGESFQRERDFTDHAAHELRTPLAAMKTQTQVLLRKAGAMPECREGLENLEASINRATHLVSQLLLLARIQYAHFPMDRFDLTGCLQDKISELRPLALHKAVVFTADIAPHVMTEGHRDSVAIMIGNLLDNAIKYTPSGGQVHVSLSAAGILDVADTGPGLNDTEKKKAFERFVRLDKTGNNGSGLGLSIASWIAQAHNLKIELLDNHPRGLRARIQWPVI